MSFLLAKSPELIEAADALAITMVLLVGISLGMILTILIVMARNAGKKPDFEEEEERDPPPAVKAKGEEESREDWERDPDWWQGYS